MSYLSDRYPDSYVKLADGTALLKDPSSLDGGSFMVSFRDDGLAEVMDVEGTSFLVASSPVAVYLCMLLNRVDGMADFPRPPEDECERIAAEMRASGEGVPPS